MADPNSIRGIRSRNPSIIPSSDASFAGKKTLQSDKDTMQIGSHREVKSSLFEQRKAETPKTPTPPKAKQSNYDQFARYTSMEALAKGIPERRVQNFLMHINGFLKQATDDALPLKKRESALLELRKYKETHEFAQLELSKMDFMEVASNDTLPLNVRMKALKELKSFPDTKSFVEQEAQKILASNPQNDDLQKQMAPFSKIATDMLYKKIEETLNRLEKFPDDQAKTKSDILKLLSFLRDTVDYRVEDACYLISICELPQCVLPQGKGREDIEVYTSDRQFGIMGPLFWGAGYGSDRCADLLIQLLLNPPKNQSLEIFHKYLDYTISAIENMPAEKKKKYYSEIAKVIQKRLQQTKGQALSEEDSEAKQMLHLFVKNNRAKKT